jgi:hypothetical protein
MIPCTKQILERLAEVAEHLRSVAEIGIDRFEDEGPEMQSNRMKVLFGCLREINEILWPIAAIVARSAMVPSDTTTVN